MNDKPSLTVVDATDAEQLAKFYEALTGTRPTAAEIETAQHELDAAAASAK